MDSGTADGPLDLVWEVEGIGREIRQTPRQTANMLARGLLPAKKVGQRWCASRTALREFFMAHSAPSRAA